MAQEKVRLLAMLSVAEPRPNANQEGPGSSSGPGRESSRRKSRESSPLYSGQGEKQALSTPAGAWFQLKSRLPLGG